MKRIISVVAISASSMIIAAASHGGTTENSLVTQTNTATATNTTNATDLKARGQQLRAEIDALYHGRKPHKEVHYNDPNGLDISDTVIKYLPIGISFDDAELILRFAGFEVSRKAAHEEGNTQATARTVAHIVPYGRFLFFLELLLECQRYAYPEDDGRL